ncbi:hypothetical protein KC323_g101 [Hortaea werneckii]|nr:hypothetical protein KC323_g101 [Hortaea werneckii]
MTKCTKPLRAPSSCGFRVNFLLRELKKISPHNLFPNSCASNSALGYEDAYRVAKDGKVKTHSIEEQLNATLPFSGVDFFNDMLELEICVRRRELEFQNQAIHFVDQKYHGQIGQRGVLDSELGLRLHTFNYVNDQDHAVC